MKRLLPLVSTLVMSCSHNPPVVNTVDRVVEIPVSVPCKITKPEKPIMPIDDLKKADPLDTKTALALAEIERRIAYEKELEAAIETCQ